MSQPHDPQSDDDLPLVVEDLALGAFRLVREALAFELDFTPETLPVLDHYLRDLSSEDTPTEAVISLVTPCAGAYFGEVIRRSLPGFRWRCPEGAYPRWRLEHGARFLRFNPVGAALEALVDEEAPGWHAHLGLASEDRVVVESSLHGSGPIAREDYYRLAVRHEVLDQTLSVLDALASERGSGPVDRARYEKIAAEEAAVAEEEAADLSD